jgi:tetratricopeptide (TPR) repeat protein
MIALGLSGDGNAQEAASAPAPAAVVETNSQETLRTYLELQGQIHELRLMVEKGRKDAQDTAVQSAAAASSRLDRIEETLARQGMAELQVLQSSNRVMIIVAGTFACVGFLAVILMVYFQWRAVSRLAEISATLPAVQGLAMGRRLPALGPGGGELVAPDSPAGSSNQRLLGALERLEKRILELEGASRPPLPEPKPETGEAKTANGNGQSWKAGAAAEAGPRPDERLARAQTLLDEDKPDEALTLLEEILKAQPAHAEGLVKKGLALERLRRLEEAAACYDRAIAADGALTIAYLHKGGLYNRMERFAEALECYEQALRTQQKR